jgi:hypothetical protein
VSTLINLTPHPIHLCDDDGVFLTLPPEPTPARCEERDAATAGVIDDRAPARPITVYAVVFGETRGLPPPAPGTYFIVSRLLAEANADRDDLLIPHQMVRDAEGKVVGCRAFSVAGVVL